jgi:AraC-like DNA-binding protein
MKQSRSFEPHLIIKQFRLGPGNESKFQLHTWRFLRITNGVGYWLHPRNNFDLETGSVLVLSAQAKGVLRASQLGEMQIHFFEVRPERLAGIVSFAEQGFLQNLAAHDHFTARHFPRNSAMSEKFKALCDTGNDSGFTWRWQLLDLFAQAFGEHLSNHREQTDGTSDARARLLKMLSDLPACELLDLDFSELVRQMGCTPRHLSRVFREVVGMSFREKQAQVRLLRAQELLATTQSKVVEVAMESGYQSLSLFNLMFKRRFGLSPAQWREQARKPKRTEGQRTEFRLLRA